MKPSAAAVRDWKLSDQIYERLFELIISGKFAENTKLPPETELAERFEVSRPVIREALAKLRDDGIIHSRQGSGSFVKRRPDQAVLHFAPIGSIADIQRCLEFRIELEGSMAKLAALRRDNENLKNIKAALDALDECIRTDRLGVEADRQFHMEVCNATKNSFFISVYESFQSQIEFGMNLARNLSLMKPATRLQLVQHEHVAIYEAIRDRDPERAQAAMVAHLGNARWRMFQGTEEAA